MLPINLLDPLVAEGIVTQTFTGVYQDDADITSDLIVNFDPTFTTNTNILEQVSVADYNAGEEIMALKSRDMLYP